MDDEHLHKGIEYAVLCKNHYLDFYIWVNKWIKI